MKTDRKTVREWFDSFPDPYRNQALEIVGRMVDADSRLAWRFNNPACALLDAFPWYEESPLIPHLLGDRNGVKRIKYWAEFYQKLKNNITLP